jgi:hypothetical protein
VRALVSHAGASGRHTLSSPRSARARGLVARAVIIDGSLARLCGAGGGPRRFQFRNLSIAKDPPIYYCATGAELPAFEPCRDRKDQRDV